MEDRAAIMAKYYNKIFQNGCFKMEEKITFIQTADTYLCIIFSNFHLAISEITCLQTRWMEGWMERQHDLTY